MEALGELKKRRRELQDSIRDAGIQIATREDLDLKERRGLEEQIREERKIAVSELSKENLLNVLLDRKNAAEKGFLRKINYAYDFQEKDIESYYRERRRLLDRSFEENETEDDLPEDDES